MEERLFLDIQNINSANGDQKSHYFRLGKFFKIFIRHSYSPKTVMCSLTYFPSTEQIFTEKSGGGVWVY